MKSQATRSRSQNRKIAREILAQKVDDALNGSTSRSAIIGDLRRKKAASAAKKSRRKYRKLEEQNEDVEETEDNQCGAGTTQTSDAVYDPETRSNDEAADGTHTGEASAKATQKTSDDKPL